MSLMWALRDIVEGGGKLFGAIEGDRQACPHALHCGQYCQRR
jgi:hypothetical protein